MGGCLPSPEYLRPIREDADNGARTFCARRHSMKARIIGIAEFPAIIDGRVAKSGGV